MIKSVYVIGDNKGPRKIGISHNIPQRLNNLGPGRGKLSVIATYPRENGDARTVERVACRLLASYRIREAHNSEWFIATDSEAVGAVEAAIRLVDSGDLSILHPTLRGNKRPGRRPVTLHVRVDDDMQAELKSVANAEDRPLAYMLAILLKEALAARVALKAIARTEEQRV